MQKRHERNNARDHRSAGGSRHPSGPGIAWVLVATLLVPVVPLGAGQQSPDDALAVETLELLSVPTEHHRHLERLIGNWVTNGRYFLPSGEAIETSGAIETVAIMNGLFVESRLVGELFGKPYHGRSIEGYDAVTEKYVSSFVETLGPWIVTQSGVCENDGRVRTMVGDVPDPVWGGTLTLRAVYTFVDDDTYRYDAFLAHEDGREFKQLEFTATRHRDD